MTAGPVAEFARPVVADQITPEGRVLTLDATEAERAALAQRFGLDALDRLVAELTVRRLGARRGATRLEVAGRLEADVGQTCVVTLAPLHRRIEEAVRQRYSDEDDATPGAVDIDAGEGDLEEPPGPIVGGVIDVGELLAETLGLAIDPHPRAPDATFEATAVPPEPIPETPAPKPFAALAALKRGADES
ncbi:YceD family protein [Roseospira goensis]|uniref:Uncharacterized metal-binding protein YceD (DUF177 family) n=1 Tax=Roseospira goensis TaxID=391922 RepID=A0A7W6WLW3_9PROT|nr:DUF177 domain-containing protein [Roseospira goensis]MBB4286847.1 uncharacterized metal-binding protein YceD (DUF177 family) [Roseospira goensis]